MKILVLALALSLLIGFASGAEQKFSINQINTTGMFLTPQMYGAVGDDTTDDSAAFQSALDAAMEDHVPLYIPGGIYLIESPLIIDNVGGVTMFGNSRTIGEQSGKSVIRYTGDGAAIRINQSTPNAYVYWVEFRDFALRGNVTNDGIYIDHLSEFLFERVWFYEFNTSVQADEMDIGTFRDCVFSKINNAIWTDDVLSVSFIGNNFCEIDNVLRFNVARSVNIMNNHMEVFLNGLLVQNSPSATAFNSINIIGNNFLNGDEYNMESRLMKINATNAANNIAIDAVHLSGNRVLMWDADYIIELDVSGTSGLTYGDAMMSGNKFEHIDKSVIVTDSGEFRWTVLDNRRDSGKPYIEGNWGLALGGFDKTYHDSQFFGPIRLGQNASTQAGDLWYDASANKLKFYNGAAVETVTSST